MLIHSLTKSLPKSFLNEQCATAAQDVFNQLLRYALHQEDAPTQINASNVICALAKGNISASQHLIATLRYEFSFTLEHFAMLNLQTTLIPTMKLFLQFWQSIQDAYYSFPVHRIRSRKHLRHRLSPTASKNGSSVHRATTKLDVMLSASASSAFKIVRQQYEDAFDILLFILTHFRDHATNPLIAQEVGVAI